MKLGTIKKSKRQEAKCISRYRFLPALPFLPVMLPPSGGAKPAAGCPEKRYWHGSPDWIGAAHQPKTDEGRKPQGLPTPIIALLTPPTTGEAIKTS